MHFKPGFCAVVAGLAITVGCQPEQPAPQPPAEISAVDTNATTDAAAPGPATTPRIGLEPTIKAVNSETPGEFQITYEWIVTQPREADWRIFVHFTDAEGKILFQNDHDPEPPTSQWVPGRRQIGPLRVSIPEEFSNTTCWIRMGLYQSGGGNRAELDGDSEPDHRVLVGRLSITDGAARFSR
jgi:hypothetical protein